MIAQEFQCDKEIEATEWVNDLRSVKGHNNSCTICKLIENLRTSLHSKDLDFLFLKFDAMDPSIMTKHHLKLMSSLSNNTTTSYATSIALDASATKIQVRSNAAQLKESESTQQITLTELFWDGYCRSNFGHYRQIPHEIRVLIVAYCHFYLLKVKYIIGHNYQFERKWKSSILRFNDDMPIALFARYLQRNSGYQLDPRSMYWQYEVGDRVMIKGGHKGYIRYISNDAVHSEHEPEYGIELDFKTSRGTDGRHKNKRLFTCRDGHAVFVRKTKITQQISSSQDAILWSRGQRVEFLVTRSINV